MVKDRREEIRRAQEKAEYYYLEDWGHGVNLELTHIPGGKFRMGSPEGEGSELEKPQHEVTVQPFFMSKYPITQAQWRAIASLPRVKQNLKLYPSHFTGYDRPVEFVAWDEAVEFCQRLSREVEKEYRLPSEAEWEYACRSGTKTSFYFGEKITEELANYRVSETYVKETKREDREKTTPVGSFPPNAFGLYDMHGNVWEWCGDDWQKNYRGAPTDGSAWLSRQNNLKVLRGGSWYNSPHLCRSAYRFSIDRSRCSSGIGFRIVTPVKGSRLQRNLKPRE